MREAKLLNIYNIPPLKTIMHHTSSQLAYTIEKNKSATGTKVCLIPTYSILVK